MDPELILILETVARITEALSFPLVAGIMAVGATVGIRIWRRRAGSQELDALRDELHQVRTSLDDLSYDMAQMQGRVDFAERLLTSHGLALPRAPETTPV